MSTGDPENYSKKIRAAFSDLGLTGSFHSGINTDRIKECLTDNISTNKGGLILSRDFIRGIVESIVIKNNLKLKEGVTFPDNIEQICDKLIGPDSEVSYPACTLKLPTICENITTAITQQLEPVTMPDFGSTDEYTDTWTSKDHNNKKYVYEKELDWGEGQEKKHEDIWNIDNPETKNILKDYLKLKNELKNGR